MYEDFVQKFASSPVAVAYGNWQISQAYQSSGDLQKALDYGDKALAAAPSNMNILVSQATVAQKLKDDAKLADYAARGEQLLLDRCDRLEQAGQTDAARKHAEALLKT